jgi:NADP-dependent 3-hydroxy acid dehydrogenase YdfG
MPHLRDGGHGHVVNVSSVAGRTASAFVGVYNATKWGVTGFSEALRQEAAHSKIRVTCVEPGFVATELQSHNTNPLVIDTLDKMQSDIGEVLQPEDIASAILHAVTAPARVNVNEVLIRPSGQAR